MAEQVKAISKEAMDQLQTTVKKDEVVVVKKILPKSDPNLGDTLCRSLCLAAYDGDVETIKVVLADERTKPNTRGLAGSSPLICAVSRNHVEAVEALLADPRVDVNITSASGPNALMFAVLGKKRVFEAILAASKVDVNMMDPHGWTALMYAAHSGNVETVEALLASKKKVDSTMRNQDGQNAFDIAAAAGREEVCRHLSL